MTSKNAIREALEREVDKLIKRHNDKVSGASLNQRRYEKRSGKSGKKSSLTTPDPWKAHIHFNPYHVRTRLDAFSRSISEKIRKNSYQLNPTLIVSVPKPTGGFREISIFSVPDAAISYWLGHRLIQRNSYRFSSYTYAYRADRNAHHAIEHLMSGIRGRDRLFVLEYDFAKYFDTIRHSYLKCILKKFFLVSDREMNLLVKFLVNPRASNITDYQAGKFENPKVGIPQGSNISLFLANVACFELDREIEQVGVTFARYADDTLVICDSYEKADQCAKLLIAHGDRSGTKINFSKSPGISLMTKGTNAEMQSKTKVDYLAHSLSSDGISISDRSIERIKRRVSKILYNNLLLQPKRGEVDKDRIGTGFHDWDLVTCVNELRRYIYGRISESALTDALTGKGRINITLCAMSFYPTVDEYGSDRLRELDGWLVDTLHRAYEKRRELLTVLKLATGPVTIDQLKSGSWYSFPQVSVETALPSFYRAWMYIRRSADVYGLEKFPSPTYDYI